MSTFCTVPPAGWVCTRQAGHSGPCAASPASARPHDEAHYWAKQIASRDEDCTESLTGEWEVVQTYDNGGNSFDLRVFVPGRELSEDVSSFVWGPRVVRPAGCEA